MMDIWYVIHSKPRQESRAMENLQAQGYEVYLPMLKSSKRRNGKWIDVVEPLFPRYLFIRLVANEDNFAPIRSTFGVSKMVKFGDTPAHVSVDLITSLRQLESSSDGLHLQSDVIFKEGAAVDVVDGPLQGIQGIVKCDSGEERVVLLFNLMGRENAMSVSRDSLVPAIS